DPGHKIGDSGLAIAVLGAQDRQLFLVAVQAKNVGRFFDPDATVEGYELFFYKIFNLKSAARDKMLKTFHYLSDAAQAPRTAPLDLVALTHGFGTAIRDMVREHERDRVRPPLVGDNAQDLRNHIAGSLQRHCVADADVQPFDLVFVVQGGVSHHDPADRDGMQ